MSLGGADNGSWGTGPCIVLGEPYAAAGTDVGSGATRRVDRPGGGWGELLDGLRLVTAREGAGGSVCKWDQGGRSGGHFTTRTRAL
eukprot:1838418-Rhodomonas_salina.1